MNKIHIINGPNLNLLGKREPEIYGSEPFEGFLDRLKKELPNVGFDYFQSNVEGQIINKLHEVGFEKDSGIILNAAGYSHTSVAIADAIAAIEVPVVEVHISNVFARESFRHNSMIAPACAATISGMGLYGYRAAADFLLKKD
ncbi:type II 3-dehydroquinate dehydratase [Halocola ammonii]